MKNLNKTKKMILLNPGPVCTSEKVRNSLLKGDMCHRESEFSTLLTNTRKKILQAFTPDGSYTTAIITGSGTASLEAGICSSVSQGKKILIINNGVYGERMSRIASVYKIDKVELKYDWSELPDINQIEETISQDTEIEVVAMVHHETTTGLINPINEAGAVIKKHGRTFFLDSISGLGGEEIDLVNDNVDICICTANKCIQGLPGLSFVLLKNNEVKRMRNIPPRSLYFNVISQLDEQEEKGECPFTPSVHTFYAFEEALDELLKEGVQGRIDRYKKASSYLRQEFKRLNLKLLLQEKLLSNTITALYLPENMTYTRLHDNLKERGFIIYAGQGELNKTIFRIANMGELTMEDLESLIKNLQEVLVE
ncbi:2-aminoethylphosphonate aminotransferase [Candidatus Scalindua japonica]|uniref:2-aminoethylphosphonate--pyruvate transaminase n=1 Tax=Candidatus Scalindua japonica TaxID=1284222 RepID=A0A286TYE7_9BACT|nr:2-aminoethylphosphonate--pyruvate transaminase [Candidatus Scalindua japonica]GAX60896.1 2-aminoethylphosphonate aminotransferase [Candidatus Scalindua japonica]